MRCQSAVFFAGVLLAAVPCAAQRVYVDLSAGRAAPIGWERDFGTAGSTYQVAVRVPIGTHFHVKLHAGMDHLNPSLVPDEFWCGDLIGCPPAKASPVRRESRTRYVGAGIGGQFPGPGPLRLGWDLTSGVARIIPRESGPGVNGADPETAPTTAASASLTYSIVSFLSLVAAVEWRVMYGMDLRTRFANDRVDYVDAGPRYTRVGTASTLPMRLGIRLTP